MSKEIKDKNLLEDDNELLDEEEGIIENLELDGLPLSAEDQLKDEVYKIDIRLQEIDANLERYEDALMIQELEIYTEEEVLDLKDEYRELRKRKKELLKRKAKTKWDTLPTWLVIYSVFQIIVSIYFLLYPLCIDFAEFLVKLFTKNDPKMWLFYIGLFFIPFILLLVSLIILLKLKDKFHKKFFAFVYGVHGLEIIATVVLMILAITE